MQASALSREERLRSKPSCVETPSERLVWQGRIWVATQMDFDHSDFCTLHHRFQWVTVSLRPRRAGLTKGRFHALRRMKKYLSLLFQALFGHEKQQNWSLWHGYSEKKKRCSKGPVELRYASVFLCASRISPFSPSLPIRNGS